MLTSEVLLLPLFNLKAKNLSHYQLHQLAHLFFLFPYLLKRPSHLATHLASLHLTEKEINLCSQLQQRMMKFHKNVLMIRQTSHWAMMANGNLPMIGS